MHARHFAYHWILFVQIALVVIGAVASMFVTQKITQLDFKNRPGAVAINVLMQGTVILLMALLLGGYYYIALINPGHPLAPPF